MRKGEWLAADLRRGFGPWWVGLLQSESGDRHHIEYHTDLHAVALVLSAHSRSPFNASMFLGPFESHQDARDISHAWRALANARVDLVEAGRRLYANLRQEDDRVRLHIFGGKQTGPEQPRLAHHSLIGDIRKRSSATTGSK